MHRRDILLKGAAAGGVTMAGPAWAGRSNGPDVLHGWLGRWLAAFNNRDLRVYKRFVEANAPSVIPYIDDDLAVRETTGGFEFVSSGITGPREITAVVRDRAWDRLSRVVLQASDIRILEDISFAGAPPGDLTLRLDEAGAIRAAREHFDRQGGEGRMSGAVLVAADDRVLLKGAYGFADGEGRRPNTLQTRFCIGSMGKMFTAVAIMQAVEAGLIRLDAPLRDYLPDYPNAVIADRVTIRHLLTHTAGTGDIFGPGYNGQEGSSGEPAHLISLYGERAPDFEPGSRWDYSNYGFVLLGRVLEAVSEKPYAAVVDEQVFRTANMSATSMGFDHPSATATAFTGARATGLKALPAYVGLPAGGGYSTAEDLHAFVSALKRGVLVELATLRTMTEPLVVAGSSYWGLGFAIRMRNGLRYFGHGGSAPGISGELAVFADYTTIVLCNRGHPAAVCAADFIGARLPIWLDRRPSP